jgi:hypothetical protein
MAGLTDWRLTSTQSTAVYVGPGVVGGGGRFNFELTDGRGSNYSASYNGIGGGAGAGLRGIPAGRIISFIMDFYMPTVRSMINAVGSQDLYLSNLYSIGAEPLNWTNLNDYLTIFALGGEIGAGLSGSLLIWSDTTNIRNTHHISSQTARLGEMTPTTEVRINAIALAIGFGVGLVDISGTATMCSCRRFTTS